MSTPPRVHGTSRTQAALPGLLAGLLPASAALLLASAAPAAAQRPLPADTLVAVDSLVVTAERTRTPLASSAAAVSVITGAQLRAVPHVTLADALRQVPGFALIDLDGLGHDPQLMVRGFYGGGEAEYVVVLLDGKPLNDVQSGLVAWDAIPLAAVERVEVVRGGSSPLWGDAAIGGVINVVTRAVAGGAAAWSLAGGSHGSWRGAGEVRGVLGGRALSLFAGADRTTGYRAHAERLTGRAGGSLALVDAPSGRLRLAVLLHGRDYDEPGPLLGADLARDRSASDVFYRFDGATDRQYRLGLDGERRLGARARLSGSLAGELRRADIVRTLELAPGYADTQERVLGTGRTLGHAQLALEGTGLPIADRLVLGLDGAYATLDSEYHDVLTGGRDQYRTATGARGALNVAGGGDRIAAAAFAQYSLLPAQAVRLTGGIRGDWLRDGYAARGGGQPAPLSSEHVAWSPRLGVNVHYLRGRDRSGNVYATASRSFKAPTLDQLFDARTIPVPFPPYAVAISSALLEPQYGVNLEAGVYHAAALVAGLLTAELSLSAYQMDMENEVDFDLQTLRYVNLGRSRHRGVEAGVRLRGAHAGTAFVNYTLQHATLRIGEHTGNFIKAIPRHALTGGATFVAAGALETGVVFSHARAIFLDDANTIELPPHTRVDARLALPLAGVRLFLDVRNLLGARYSTTGFPDPSGTGAVYYRPAAGRTVDLGVRGGF